MGSEPAPRRARFEELDWVDTPMGELSLRRRREPTTGLDVYEVKLGEEWLMSSLFTASEEALARIGLEAVRPARGDGGLHVVVGGLGLGYTARTALLDDGVAELVVVEVLPPVIAWHERGLLPGAAALVEDPRTVLRTGDFFAMARGDGFDPAVPGRRWDAVLLDVDHSPDHVLHGSHADLYTADGLTRFSRLLSPGGVFGLWSDDPPDEAFADRLRAVFADVRAHVVDFANPLTGGRSACTVYVATAAG
ncbi:spermidine synthase [Aquipuribacter sp. SD81]|uniref:spermidine synthase n=1 Tax=Aquipuribacter sp. SD81 TaxID=3127703 RepID=UPI0030165B0A